MRKSWPYVVVTILFLGANTTTSGGVESLQFFVASPTEATNKAAVFLSEQSQNDKCGSLKIQRPNPNAFDFCKALNERLEGIYIAPLSKYRQCDRKNTALAALDFPFIAEDWAKARALLDGAIGFAIAETLYKRGVNVLSFWDGETTAFSSTKPLKTAGDFKGHKVRAQASFASESVLQSSGATAFPLMSGELYTAMQQGVMDAADVSLASFTKIRLYEVNKFILLSNHYIDPYVLTIPSKTWEALTAHQKAFLDEVTRSSTLLQIAEAKKALFSDITILKEQGITVTPFSREIARSFITPASVQASLTMASQVFANSPKPLSDAAILQVLGQQPTVPYWKVFFVTNRARNGSSFTNDLAPALSYGEADVKLDWDGPVVQPTELQAESTRNLISFSQSTSDIKVDWNSITSNPFPRDLVKVPHSMPAKAPMIYVHGFANSFQDAVRRAAWIGWNAKRPAIAFAWASQGSILPADYRKDQQTATRSWVSFAQLLRNLGNDYDAATDLDIIVHSMGAFTLLGALEELQKRNGAGKPVLFRQLVLVAPDVGSATLEKTWESLAKYFSRQATLYVSDHDLALGISRNLMNFKDGDRAGLAPPVMVTKGIESVFIGRNEFSFTGHSYHVANGVIADDILELLRYGSGAAERRGCGLAPSPDKYFVLHRLKDL